MGTTTAVAAAATAFVQPHAHAAGVKSAFQVLSQAVLSSQEIKEREADEMKLSISLEQSAGAKAKGGCC